MKTIAAPTFDSALADAIRHAADVIGPLGVYAVGVALTAALAAYLAKAL